MVSSVDERMMSQGSREMNDVHQRHMSEVSDAPPGDSRDVTQFSHNLHQYSFHQQKPQEG